MMKHLRLLLAALTVLLSGLPIAAQATDPGFYARQTYPTDGTINTFFVPFPVIHQTDVQVYLNNILIDPINVTFPSCCTLHLDFTPTAGSSLRLVRKTGIDTAAASFHGGPIASLDLNRNATQELFATQEAFDQGNTRLPMQLVQGYQATFQVLNDASTQNYYFAVNDTSNNDLWIGGGYGPGQGIPPSLAFDHLGNSAFGYNIPRDPMFNTFPGSFHVVSKSTDDWLATFAREGLHTYFNIASASGGAFGPQTSVQLMSSRGTITAPTPLLSGDIVGVLGPMGYDGTAGWLAGMGVDYSAEIAWYATEDFAPGHRGAQTRFYYVPNGTQTITLGFVMDQDGGFYANGATGGSKGAGTINGTLYQNGSALTAPATAPVGQLPGATTSALATAGNVGELICGATTNGGSSLGCQTNSTTAVSLTTATPANITQVTLSAGQWEICANLQYTPAGTTTVAYLDGAISTTSATLPTYPAFGAAVETAAAFTTGAFQSLSVGCTPRVLSGSTTFYLVGRAGFGVSTMVAAGYINATRTR